MDDGQSETKTGALSSGVGVGAGIIGALIAVALVLGVTLGTPQTSGENVGETVGESGGETGQNDSAANATDPAPETRLVRDNDAIEFEARWPALPEARALQARFAQDAADALAALEPESRQSMTEFDGALRYSYQSEWQRAGQAGNLISLARTEYAFTGGAHGNTGFDSLIYDTARTSEIVMADLFEGQALPFVLKAEICKGLVAEKLTRTGSADVFGEPLACTPNELERVIDPAILVLTGPQNGQGFTAIEAIYPQYTMGSYAEGPYQVRVPAALFVNAVKPQYRAAFETNSARDAG
jgi:hypothetical protein